ncbi:cyclic nucleotide-binding domain-containing protein [Rhodovulum sp. DZ06]|uniref:cyclic nucleotide-binding domain-containing protein n=1 Tax=Rhodovulum sp. DZ06 TaxID=3425126 RepID=UPI003D329910
MIEYIAIDDPRLFVRLAIALYITGLLLRNQVHLRVSILAGSFCYIMYYMTGQATPQWDAAFGSMLIVTANLYGLGTLLLSRLALGMREDERAMLSVLGPVEPGLLRRLVRMGETMETREEITLTRQGERPERLWWIIEGRAGVEKDGKRFTIDPQVFVGEVSWMLGGPATATVTLPPGARCVSWDRSALRRRLGRRPRLEEAMHAMIGMDMARKVARSHQAEGARPAAAAV